MSDVRGRLRTDAGEHYDRVLAALLDATEATRIVKATCPHCKKRHEVETRDHAVAVKAAEALVQLGHGKQPPKVEEEIDYDVDVSKMDAELRAAFRQRLLRDNPKLQEWLKNVEAAAEADLRPTIPQPKYTKKRKAR